MAVTLPLELTCFCMSCASRRGSRGGAIALHARITPTHVQLLRKLMHHTRNKALYMYLPAATICCRCQLPARLCFGLTCVGSVSSGGPSSQHLSSAVQIRLRTCTQPAKVPTTPHRWWTIGAVLCRIAFESPSQRAQSRRPVVKAAQVNWRTLVGLGCCPEFPCVLQELGGSADMLWSAGSCAGFPGVCLVGSWEVLLTCRGGIRPLLNISVEKLSVPTIRTKNRSRHWMLLRVG